MATQLTGWRDHITGDGGRGWGHTACDGGTTQLVTGWEGHSVPPPPLTTPCGRGGFHQVSLVINEKFPFLCFIFLVVMHHLIPCLLPFLRVTPDNSRFTLISISLLIIKANIYLLSINSLFLYMHFVYLHAYLYSLYLVLSLSPLPEYLFAFVLSTSLFTHVCLYYVLVTYILRIFSNQLLLSTFFFFLRRKSLCLATR